MLVINILTIQVNIILDGMPEDLIHGKAALVQEMAWFNQATSVDQDFLHHIQ